MAHRILLADDSLTIQKVVELTFSESEYELMTVGDGDKAVAGLDSFRPDIVLADVVMPGFDGYTVCEMVKSRPDGAFIPVVLLTGTFERFDRARAERVGCDSIVTKPFDSHALANLVADLLRKAGAARAAHAAAPETTSPDEELGWGAAPMEADAFAPEPEPEPEPTPAAFPSFVEPEPESAAVPLTRAASIFEASDDAMYATTALRIPSPAELGEIVRQHEAAKAAAALLAPELPVSSPSAVPVGEPELIAPPEPEVAPEVEPTRGPLTIADYEPGPLLFSDEEPEPLSEPAPEPVAEPYAAPEREPEPLDFDLAALSMDEPPVATVPAVEELAPILEPASAPEVAASADTEPLLEPPALDEGPIEGPVARQESAPVAEPEPEPLAGSETLEDSVGEPEAVAPVIDEGVAPVEAEAAPGDEAAPPAERLAELEPMAAELEPMGAELEPMAAELEPMAAELEPMAAELEPMAAEPEPFAAEPEPVALSPEVVAAGPEPVEEEPVPWDTVPEDEAAALADTTETEPEAFAPPVPELVALEGAQVPADEEPLPFDTEPPVELETEVFAAPALDASAEREAVEATLVAEEEDEELPTRRDVDADLAAYESSGRDTESPREVWEHFAAAAAAERGAQSGAEASSAGVSTGDLEALAATTSLTDLKRLIPSEPSAPSVLKEPYVLTDVDVDRIARRVVELMGEKTVRDIAWEVVPEMAERFVRARIEELEKI